MSNSAPEPMIAFAFIARKRSSVSGSIGSTVPIAQPLPRHRGLIPQETAARKNLTTSLGRAVRSAAILDCVAEFSRTLHPVVYRENATQPQRPDGELRFAIDLARLCPKFPIR